LVDKVGVVPLPDLDTALNRERSSSDPYVVKVERLDPTAQRVHALRNRREADAERIQHARLSDAVDADDEIDARLEAKLGCLDAAQVGEPEARDDHAALPTSICPVTAAAMRAERRSLSNAIVDSVAARRSSRRRVATSM